MKLQEPGGSEVIENNHEPRVSELTAYLSLPFVHKFSGDQLSTGDLPAGRHWHPWTSRLTKSQEAAQVAATDGTDSCSLDERALDLASEYSYFFLPQSRKLLFPEFDLSEGTATEGVADDNGGGGPFLLTEALDARDGSATRLTSFSGEIPLVERLEFVSDAGCPIAFQLDWIDALIFPQHIGVLLLKVRLLESANLSDVAAMLRALRKNRSRRRLTVAVPTVKHSVSGHEFAWSSIPNLLLTDLRSDRVGEAAVVEETIGTTFKSMVVAGITADEPGDGFANFDDGLEAATFALATGHFPGGGFSSVDQYTKRGIERFRSDTSYESWENWRVVAYDEGIAIGMLAGSTSAGRSALGKNLAIVQETAEWAYCLGHALATAQAARVHLLSRQLTGLSSDMEAALVEIEDFEHAYVRFRQILWQPEITTAPVGSAIYDLSVKAFRLHELSGWLDRDVQIVRSYLALRRDRLEAASARRTTSMLEFLTIVGIPVGLALTALQTELDRSIAPFARGKPWFPFVFVAGVTLLASAAFIWVRVRRDR